MTRTEYEAAICEQLPGAEVVPFENVQGNGWDPLPGCCHRNVDRWTEEMPGHDPVRGWVVYPVECMVGNVLVPQLTAHSVVRQRMSGGLFDIKPIQDENWLRPRMRFVPHVGDEASFWVFENSNRMICCPNCD